MTALTPETLRELANDPRLRLGERTRARLYAAADAWEKLQHEYDGLTDIADGFYHTVIEVVAETDRLSRQLAASDAWEADVEDKDRYLAESKRNMEGWTNCVMEIASLRNRLEAAEKDRDAYKGMLSASNDLIKMLTDNVARMREEG